MASLLCVCTEFAKITKKKTAVPVPTCEKRRKMKRNMTSASRNYSSSLLMFCLFEITLKLCLYLEHNSLQNVANTLLHCFVASVLLSKLIARRCGRRDDDDVEGTRSKRSRPSWAVSWNGNWWFQNTEYLDFLSFPFSEGFIWLVLEQFSLFKVNRGSYTGLVPRAPSE